MGEASLAAVQCEEGPARPREVLEPAQLLECPWISPEQGCLSFPAVPNHCKRSLGSVALVHPRCVLEAGGQRHLLGPQHRKPPLASRKCIQPRSMWRDGVSVALGGSRTALCPRIPRDTEPTGCVRAMRKTHLKAVARVTVQADQAELCRSAGSWRPGKSCPKGPRAELPPSGVWPSLPEVFNDAVQLPAWWRLLNLGLGFSPKSRGGGSIPGQHCPGSVQALGDGA